MLNGSLKLLLGIRESIVLLMATKIK